MRKLAQFIAFTILAFAAMVGAKFFLSHHLAVKTAGFGGLESTAGVDLLFIGSSHTRQGYSARAIEQATGKTAYVLAYNALDAVFMREVLHYLLEKKNLRVQRLIIEAYAMNAALHSRLQDFRLFNDSPASLKKKLLVALRETGNGGWTKLYELLVLGGNETLLTAPVFNRVLVNKNSYHGAYTTKIAPPLSPGAFSHVADEIPASLKPALDPQQQAAWEDIFRLVRARGVKAEFVEVPVPSPVAKNPIMAQIKQAFADLVAQNGFRYIDLSDEGKINAANPEFFTDWNHLSSIGREAYSRAFTDWLAQIPR